METLRTIRNYLFYCGIEKDEYNALKKDAYVSNFEVWRFLHCFMTVMFSAMFVTSTDVALLAPNRPFYLMGFVYSLIATILFFFVFKKDSIVAQLLIYLSISILFLFGAFIAQNRPELPSTTFIVFLLITPMFMIDKPYFMAIELCAASAVFLVWMRGVKSYDVWKIDCGNIIIFVVIGFVLHVIANSIRIKEFVLTRKINMQKDMDDLTGLKNKGAVTRAINEYLSDESTDKGIMFLLDVDHFKAINDTFGHDVGDSVISQFGALLNEMFTDGEIIGRFGGDEFILFIKDAAGRDFAADVARRIVDAARERVELPDKNEKISVSMGIALYHGQEKHYSEIFKKADVALYKTKADRTVKFNFYDD